MMHTTSSTFVEVKTVTWCKDSHGLFDYESKNVTFTKTKVDSSCRMYKEGTDIHIRAINRNRNRREDINMRDPNYLFSIVSNNERPDSYHLEYNVESLNNDDESNKLFVVVRSLKNEEGIQKGYELQVGDVIRLGRIEYKVLEYQNHNRKTFSLLNGSQLQEKLPFELMIKTCLNDSEDKKQCRICLMDEQDTPEALVNPCNCKGTSAYVHIQCLQDWISSKLKKKVNLETTCYYWKKLNCEVCKVNLPDLVKMDGVMQELIPIHRPQSPYILLERVFYDKSKENADNTKMMVLLDIQEGAQPIKLGRGHECELRENDISVSRLHAFIKYEDGHFNIIDNNSKFGTLVMLRKNFKIEKNRKLAIQLGRTVTTFSLKQSHPNRSIAPKSLVQVQRTVPWQSPKINFNFQLKPLVVSSNRTKHIVVSSHPETHHSDLNINGSFLD